MNRGRTLGLAVAGVALLIAGGLLLRAEFAPEPREAVLRVLCSQELQYPAEDIVGAFQRRTGVRVELHIETPEALLAQIEDEGDADVLLPGSRGHLEEAAARNLVAEQEVVAWYLPTLLVQHGNPLDVAELADLARPGLRVGLMRADLPGMGSATQALLEGHGLSADALGENLVLVAEGVHELSQGVALRQVDVALVPRPVAHLYEERAASVPIPREDNVPVPLHAVFLTTSAQVEDAREFLEFLRSAVARDIFLRHHYEVEE